MLAGVLQGTFAGVLLFRFNGLTFVTRFLGDLVRLIYRLLFFLISREVNQGPFVASVNRTVVRLVVQYVVLSSVILVTRFGFRVPIMTAFRSPTVNVNGLRDFQELRLGQFIQVFLVMYVSGRVTNVLQYGQSRFTAVLDGEVRVFCFVNFVLPSGWTSSTNASVIFHGGVFLFTDYDFPSAFDPGVVLPKFCAGRRVVVKDQYGLPIVL